MPWIRSGAAAFVLSLTWSVSAAEPRVLDNRLKLELFAEQPQIVTPTGIDVDHRGRVWTIESNTHFPPEGYSGHPSDRVLVMEDADGDGRADKTTVFADGLRHAMSIAVWPVWLDEVKGLELRLERQKEQNRSPSASVSQPTALSPQPAIFVATRREILLLRDTDGDLQADERQTLVRLDTKGDYPHNGLAGFAFDALGWMLFGFGENLGESYRIIGSDGVTLSGGGEGGNLYRCRPDGTKLEQWATGFWNPHASCFDAFGRMFTVDNDPDSRPPCRLLHIIPGGDYGYRFRNGRKGTHPFTSWNGEIPGTLPMVSGTGEAPSGIICYESDGFPDDYLGTLLVGSWGDHRIDKFVLEPKGASFVSRPQPIVQGDENFRPVGLALAPDGSVYFSDWVLRDYKLHGKGRVWRLSADRKSTLPEAERSLGTTRGVSSEVSRDSLVLECSPRLIERRSAARRLARTTEGRKFLESSLNSSLPVRCRIESLWALAAAPAENLAKLLGMEGKRADYLKQNDEVTEAAFRLCRYLPRAASDQGADFQEFNVEGGEASLVRIFGEWIAQYRSDLRKQKLGGVPWIVLFERTDDPFLQHHAFESLVRSNEFFVDANSLERMAGEGSTNEGSRLFFLLHARRTAPKHDAVARVGLSSSSEPLRFAAVQWVGEERLASLRTDVERLLTDPLTSPRLLLACLATLSLLDGVPASEFEKTPPAQYALAMVGDEARPAALRATALRLIPPSLPELKGDLLTKLAQSADKTLQIEAVRTLQQSPRPESLPVLLKLADDASADVAVRADAISALCAIVPHEAPLPDDVEVLLLRFARDGIPVSDASQKRTDVEPLQLEAIRSLRGRAGEGSTIRQVLENNREAAGDNRVLRDAIDLALTGKSTFDPSDSQALTLNSQPEAGRRVFFAHQGPLCAKCHTVHGRGGNIGPDLSTIARTMSRQKLIESILDPSREISPYFLTWSIATATGKVHTGLVITENGGGDVQLGDSQGNVIVIPRKEIEERAPSKVSVMPQGLHQRMTAQEFADLIAYLESLK